MQVAFTAASAAPAVWLTVLLAAFCAHVACHLPYHPWFLVKVLWPVATTMVITDILHLLPAVMVRAARLDNRCNQQPVRLLVLMISSCDLTAAEDRVQAAGAATVCKQPAAVLAEL
jgi:hypothetical protein